VDRLKKAYAQVRVGDPLDGMLNEILYDHLFWQGFYFTFCHIESVQQPRIRGFGWVVIENPLNIFIFPSLISTIVTPSSDLYDELVMLHCSIWLKN
jgi:hypothetical protein